MFFNGFGACPVFASDREHQVMQSDHCRNLAVGSVAVLFFHPLCGVENDFHIAVSGLLPNSHALRIKESIFHHPFIACLSIRKSKSPRSAISWRSRGLWINHLWPLAYLFDASQFMILHASFIFIALPPSQLLKD